MKISCNWLREYVDLPESISELAEKLTNAGIEVEDIAGPPTIPDGVLVARILERQAHPNADKLSVCVVDYGGGRTTRVVCGAPNCEPGVLAPLATLGTILPGVGEIREVKIRGEKSMGMLCAADELGLGGDHTGIIVLPSDSEPGRRFAEIIDSDTVCVVEITPNRPDLLSHWGIARDLAALTGGKLRFPETSLPAAAISAPADLVEVADGRLCPRYTARIIEGVEVGESPEWLKRRLAAIGLRPINSVVDVTNFVLHELGHPLHAFDLDLLEGKRVLARPATAGEKITTLDGRERVLSPSHLVIADAKSPIALAGVMGGESTGVTTATRRVLLESAVFDADNIRATSRGMPLSSDSSYRFERGVDYEMAKTASDRAVGLIISLAGGKISELVDVAAPPPPRPSLNCRFSKVRSLLGVEVADAEIVGIFQRLGLTVADGDAAGSRRVTPPSYRHDLEREADLIEEVARIHGLDAVPEAPLVARKFDGLPDAYAPLQKLRSQLIGLGLFETMNYSMADEASALADERFAAGDLVRLDNPISNDLAVLRPSLFAGMLQTLVRNISRKNSDLALFELGNVFCGNPRVFPEERQELAVAYYGRRHPELHAREGEAVYDLLDLKGTLERLCEIRGLAGVKFRRGGGAMFEPGCRAEMTIDGQTVGVLGQVAKKLLEGARAEHPVYVALVQVNAILAAAPASALYQPISPFPATSRDIAFVVGDDFESGAFTNYVEGLSLPNLESVKLFDIFTDERQLGSGRKSMAYNLTFRHAERTLTDKEVNEVYERLRQGVAAEFAAQLR